MRGGWVYIMTNRPDGTLYTGVTSDIARRAFEHREGRIDGFTRRYGLKRLVLTEFYEDIRDAIQREGNIKHSPRALKVRLIHAANSDRCNLYEDLNAGADEKDVDGRVKPTAVRQRFCLNWRTALILVVSRVSRLTWTRKGPTPCAIPIAFSTTCSN